MFEINPRTAVQSSATAPRPVTLVSFTPKQLAKQYTYIVIALTLAFIISGVLRKLLAIDSVFTNTMYSIFNMDGEANLPAAFSFLNLITASLLLIFLARTSVKKQKAYWLLLSIIFIFLAFDELLQVHEHIGRLVGTADGSRDGWKIPYAMAACVIGCLMVRFLVQLPRQTRYRFVIAGAVFVACAIGIDYVQSVLLNKYHISRYHQLLTLIEEPGEMLAIIFFIYAILDYISPNNRRLHLIST